MKRYKPTAEDIAMMQTENTGKIKRHKVIDWLLVAFGTALFFVGIIGGLLLFIEALPDPVQFR